MASISGDASTAVTSLAWRSRWLVHTPGPQASSSTLPVGWNASSAFVTSSPPEKLQALIQIVRGQGPVVGELLIEETVEFVW